MSVLTRSQWLDWVEWASVEPIGDERDDWRAAYAAAGIAACWADGVKVESFKVDWLKERCSDLPLDERIKLAVMAHNAREAAKNGG